MTSGELRRALLGRARRLRHQPANRRFATRLEHDPAAPALILSPHPDDAVINCWSVLDGTADRRPAVANVFAGIPPAGAVTAWDRVCGADESAAMMRQRLSEDREALGRVGCVPVDLPFLDAQYRGTAPPPSFAAVDAAIARAVPAVSIVYAPLGTRHSDHRFARGYAAALARCGIPARIYADVPYVSELGWPAWVTGEPPHPRLDVASRFDELLSTVPEVGDPRGGEAVRLDPERAAAKLAAIRAYATQITALDQGPLGIVSNPSIHSFELFWPLRPR
jgi:LmbE family N-acetylglucosaminyl deacetylase